jgi:cation transport ATPase
MRIPHGLSNILHERVLRRALIGIAISGLTCGILAKLAHRPELAEAFWWMATLPVAAGLIVSIIRDLIAGRLGVDAIALVAMIGALALGQPLAGAVIALMYSGGNLLEDIAVARAEKNLRTLVERAPRVGHRDTGHSIEDVPVGTSPSVTGCSSAPGKSFRSMASSTRPTP